MCFHITHGHIPPRIARIFGLTCLLTITKPWDGVRPIVMGKTLYRFTSFVLCFQFYNAFVTHFSPHQFKIATKGGCEIVIHGIMCTLDPHLEWVILQLDVANAFNLMLKEVIFQEFCVTNGDIIQLSSCIFYIWISRLFYNDHNHEGDVTIILFAMGTHQGDHLGGHYLFYPILGLYII